MRDSLEVVANLVEKCRREFGGPGEVWDCDISDPFTITGEEWKKAYSAVATLDLKLTTLELNLAEARKDTKRLDWIDQNMHCDLINQDDNVVSFDACVEGKTLRSAIDAEGEKT